jgi:hypothetical protein
LAGDLLRLAQRGKGPDDIDPTVDCGEQVGRAAEACGRPLRPTLGECRFAECGQRSCLGEGVVQGSGTVACLVQNGAGRCCGTEAQLGAAEVDQDVRLAGRVAGVSGVLAKAFGQQTGRTLDARKPL